MRLPRDRHRSRSVVLAERAYQHKRRMIERMEFYIDAAGEHRWRIKGANGEIIGASSEGFSARTNAEANAVLLHMSMSPWVAEVTSET